MDSLVNSRTPGFFKAGRAKAVDQNVGMESDKKQRLEKNHTKIAMMGFWWEACAKGFQVEIPSTSMFCS